MFYRTNTNKFSESEGILTYMYHFYFVYTYTFNGYRVLNSLEELCIIYICIYIYKMNKCYKTNRNIFLMLPTSFDLRSSAEESLCEKVFFLQIVFLIVIVFTNLIFFQRSDENWTGDAAYPFVGWKLFKLIETGIIVGNGPEFNFWTSLFALGKAMHPTILLLTMGK